MYTPLLTTSETDSETPQIYTFTPSRSRSSPGRLSSPRELAEEQSVDRKLYEVFWKTSISSSTDGRIEVEDVAEEASSWEIQIKQKLRNYALSHSSMNPEQLVDKFVKKQGVSATPIKKRMQVAQSAKKRDFLKPFLQIEDPSRFLRCLHTLTKDERPNFFEIVGGKKAISLLKKMFNKASLKNMMMEIGKILELSKCITSIEGLNVKFEQGFDAEFPISFISGSNIYDTFRYFLCTELAGQVFFKINGASIPLPYLTDSKQNKKTILIWLIQNLERFISDASSVKSPEDQAELLFTSYKEEKELTKKGLIYFFEELRYTLDDLLIWAKTREANLPIAFRSWIKKQLPIILGGSALSLKPSDEIAQLITDLYITARPCELIRNTVPCGRILQAISFSSFSTATKSLRTHLFPKLFHSGRDLPRLKKFPTDPTYYKIKIESDTFTATQIKPHRIFVGDPKADHTVLGKIDIRWTVKGSLKSDRFSALLSCHNLRFVDDVDLSLSEQAVNMMQGKD